MWDSMAERSPVKLTEMFYWVRIPQSLVVSHRNVGCVCNDLLVVTHRVIGCVCNDILVVTHRLIGCVCKGLSVQTH